MTFIWFIIWVIANNVGAAESLTFDPVNMWAGSLLLCIALDLGGTHARSVSGTLTAPAREASESRGRRPESSR